MEYDPEDDRVWCRWCCTILLFLLLGALVYIMELGGFEPNPKHGMPAPAPTTQAQPGEYQIYPDPVRTPGAVNPDITADNMKQNICDGNGGWSTKDVRPPVSYTNKLKKKQIEEYGYKDKDMKSYEEDHLIPLALGGHPTDPKNLWPESRLSKPLNAYNKDQVEVYLSQQVCKGKIGLDDARKRIATDWVSVYNEMTGSGFVDPWAKQRKEP